MYKIAGDTHTHTVACGHAYSTISENAQAAAALGHYFLITTEHTISVQGAPGEAFFKNLPNSVPRILHNVLMLFGCEVNICSDGSLDMEQNVLDGLDWVIASMHGGIMDTDLGSGRYTEYWLNVLENPAVDCLGHIGTPKYACDYEVIVRRAAELGKIIEINSASPIVRKGSNPNCRIVAELCKKHGVYVVLSSDAHFHTRVGDVYSASQLLEEIDFPQELILNANYSKLRRYISAKRGRELPSAVDLIQTAK